MTQTVHLIVERGHDKGKSITVPPEGARLGRSSRNDIVLIDPLLSRHHSRLFFKTGAGLWITDLGSANETLVNGRPIQETRINVGDLVSVGDTTMKVLSDAMPGAQPSTPTPVISPSKSDSSTPVNLGLADKPARSRKKLAAGPLLLVAALVCALALAAWIPKLLKKAEDIGPVVPSEANEELSFEVDYEKIDAGTDNIFTYRLAITSDNLLTVRIDDLENGRHVRKEKHLNRDYIESLARTCVDLGFFELSPEYRGIAPDNLLERWDLTITINKRTRRVMVENRVPPEIFAEVRDAIEECGRNELGLWAIQFSREKLIAMATEASLLGRKLYEEREIRYGNLASAIKSLSEAEWYLETVDPKPDFYADTLSWQEKCRSELKQRHVEQNFQAERAIKLVDWPEAVRNLQILCEMIPDRSDPRNKDARKKLIFAQKHLDMK